MIEFKVKPDRKNEAASRLLQSIARNAQKAANAVAYDVASRYRDRVKEGLMGAGERFRTMLDGICLVTYNKGDVDLFAVIAEMRTVKESEVDAELMTVTVIPKVEEAWLRLLADESPWPLTWLPRKLRPDQAELVGRRVRQDEMERLREAKKPRLENILSQIKAYGIDTDVSAAEAEVEIRIDTNWEAIRAEYGLDGFERVPVWQPALKEVLANRRRLVEVMEKALLHPQTMPTERAATGAEIGSIQRFQDTIKT